MNKPRENKPRPITLADGSIRYEMYVKAEGRTKYLGRFDTEGKAAVAADDFYATLRQRARGKANGEELAPIDGLTVRAASELWLEYLATPGVSGHRSRRKYADQFRLHVLPKLGEENVYGVKPTHVSAFMRSLTVKKGAQSGREGKILTTQTVNTIRIALSALFTWMVKEQHWLESNPVHGTRQLKPQRREFQWIHNPENVTRLVESCETTDLRDFVGLLVTTGMRLGECLALHWSDVNLSNRTLRVHAGGAGEDALTVKPTKTGKARTVPLLDAAFALLTARRRRHDGTGFVFASPQGGGIRNPSTFRDGFEKALATSKISQVGLPKIRIHDLRHTFACHWVGSGGDIYALAKVLGHATVRTTEEYYADYAVENFRQHYGRCNFAMPSAPATVTRLHAV